MPSGAAGVVIVGGGLAGSLLALALREQGAAVELIDAAPAAELCTATEISYGAMPGWPLLNTPLARLAAGASRRWRGLQRRHGELGWRPQQLRLLGPNRALSALSRLGLLLLRFFVSLFQILLLESLPVFFLHTWSRRRRGGRGREGGEGRRRGRVLRMALCLRVIRAKKAKGI